MKAVIVRQRKPWRRKDGTTIFCEDNAAVILNNKKEVRGNGINGPVAKEAADLWPKVSTMASSVL